MQLRYTESVLLLSAQFGLIWSFKSSAGFKLSFSVGPVGRGLRLTSRAYQVSQSPGWNRVQRAVSDMLPLSPGQRVLWYEVPVPDEHGLNHTHQWKAGAEETRGPKVEGLSFKQGIVSILFPS